MDFIGTVPGTVCSSGKCTVREKREAGGVQKLGSEAGQQRPALTFVRRTCDWQLEDGPLD